MRKEISNRVKKVSFCSVIADTTPDVSHSDELSVSLRFINADTSEAEERLVRIMETKDKTGLGSANDIIKCLNLSDIPLEEVMFQTHSIVPRGRSTICLEGKYLTQNTPHMAW